MDCPRCSGVEMNDVLLEQDALVRICEECSSLWIDTADLTRMLVHHNLPSIDALGGRENLEEAAGTCPEDMTDLTVIESAQNDGLAFAMCELCGGLWLSRNAEGKEFLGKKPEEIVEELLAFFGAFAAPWRARV